MSPISSHASALARVLPGTVWWCDGVALAFDPYFKRRPVLVVGVHEGGAVTVIPLSSKRRYGQETAVVHDRGVSYMTGTVTSVDPVALIKPMGTWDGFAVWFETQTDPPPTGSILQRFWLWIRRVFRLDSESEVR